MTVEINGVTITGTKEELKEYLPPPPPNTSDPWTSSIAWTPRDTRAPDTAVRNRVIRERCPDGVNYRETTVDPDGNVVFETQTLLAGPRRKYVPFPGGAATNENTVTWSSERMN